MATSRESIITKRVPFQVLKNVRSDLKEKIAKNWLGETNSSIGIQYLDFNDGVIHFRGHSARTDVILIQWQDTCNVFIEVDGYKSIQPFGDIKLSDREKKYITIICEEFLDKEREYIEHEKHFLDSRPWEQLDGLTPEQAISKLTELGF